jgi:hypothetical protein
MIRFMPDTWQDAVLRPIAMAAPDGGVYVETIAPDLRFVFILLLLVVWLLFRMRGFAPLRSPARRLTLGLLAFTALTFVPWLATTGNGRYFIAVLFLAGPVAIALLYHLPLSRHMQLALAGLMIALQVGLVHENAPWDSWGLAPWKQAPAFDVEIPADMRTQPATYVTVYGISYSLIAPRFDPDSRWISLASQQGGSRDEAMAERVRAFLASASTLRLLLPSPLGEPLTGMLPAAHIEALNRVLAPHSLQLVSQEPCRVLRSAGLTSLGEKVSPAGAEKPLEARAFLVCPLQRVTGPTPPSARPDPQAEAVFARIEQACPRLFAPGEASTTVLPGGYRRFYVSSDMRLYVLSNGSVMYKYIRALNMALVGSVQDVLSPAFRMDCDHVKGRTGLPWEREI